ncbi:MAG: RNA 2',3'-cyclic phosphodiesterase [Rhizobiaceae bacterium]
MPRLFTGLEVPSDVADALAALRGGLPGARWAQPDDYHITLRFIGDIDGRTAREIEDELAEARVEPMTVTLTGLDAFGGAKPHSIFAQVATSRPLIELQSEHERRLRRVGLPPEKRKFTPHVTLARLRQASVLDVADFLSTRGGFPAISFTPERFVLYSAREQTGGGPYVVEAAYPLE